MKETIVQKLFKKENGFTLIEIISVIIMIGILAVIAVSRTVNYEAEAYAGADALKSHLRYAQTMAMNTNPSAGTMSVWGISGTANSYWLFEGTNPADADSYSRPPEEDSFINDDRTVNLTKKKIKLSGSFTIYFDNRGIPYSSYTNETSNTPLASALTINVQPLNSSTPSVPVTITPLTGYVP